MCIQETATPTHPFCPQIRNCVKCALFAFSTARGQGQHEESRNFSSFKLHSLYVHFDADRHSTTSRLYQCYKFWLLFYAFYGNHILVHSYFNTLTAEMKFSKIENMRFQGRCNSQNNWLTQSTIRIFIVIFLRVLRGRTSNKRFAIASPGKNNRC